MAIRTAAAADATEGDEGVDPPPPPPSSSRRICAALAAALATSSSSTADGAAGEGGCRCRAVDAGISLVRSGVLYLLHGERCWFVGVSALSEQASEKRLCSENLPSVGLPSNALIARYHSSCCSRDVQHCGSIFEFDIQHTRVETAGSSAFFRAP